MTAAWRELGNICNDFIQISQPTKTGKNPSLKVLSIPLRPLSLSLFGSSCSLTQAAIVITAMDNSNHHGQGSQDSREMPEQARLRKSAFRTAFLKFVFSLSWLLILPHFRSLNWLVSLFRPTTDEAKNAALVRRALIPVAVICVLVTAPVCLFVLPLYVLSHLGRRPFTYHVMAEVCMSEGHRLWRSLPAVLLRWQFSNGT